MARGAPAPYSPPMMRASLFALTWVASFAYWAVVKPTSDMTASMMEWPQVLAFSTVLFLLAIALPVYGRMVGGRWVARLSLVAGSGMALSSIANVVEDGLHVEWAFLVFVVAS